LLEKAVALEIQPIQQPDWLPLPHEGCVQVEYKPLIKSKNVALALLRFGPNGTIHEHPADIEIDVICLEGQGFTSVGGDWAAIQAGQRVHWPAGQPHRLWTEASEMITLMVEHRLKLSD
jgi:quercetin dioxygenase-like cupin family protein